MLTGEQFKRPRRGASMLDGWIRTKDIRPLTGGRYKEGEWPFHRTALTTSGKESYDQYPQRKSPVENRANFATVSRRARMETSDPLRANEVGQPDCWMTLIGSSHSSALAGEMLRQQCG